MTTDRRVSVAGLTLELPDGFAARCLSDPSSAPAVIKFVSASPDATIYHQPAYIEFARRENGVGDLLLIERDGAPQFALPVHPVGARNISTGYSGVVFPPGAREATQKRAVRSLKSLIDCNSRIELGGLQAAQAEAYEDADRMSLLAWLIEQEGLAGPALWTRVLRRPARDESQLAGDADEVTIKRYDGDVRNQIRQARRRGVEVECRLPEETTDVANAYREFTSVHEESWQRTGLRPHPVDYWVELNKAIVGGGGSDLMVLARSVSGETIAAVTCHIFGHRAIYWAGASRTAGLEQRANPLCLHTAISKCWSLGVVAFELGRFSPSEAADKEKSITDYKAQFGGQVVRLTTLSTPRTAGRWFWHQAYRARRRLAGAS